MSAPTQKKAKIGGGQLAAPEPFFHYDGEGPLEWMKNNQELTRLRVVDIVELGWYNFYNCRNLVDVELNEGLRVIDTSIFHNCTALRRVILPSTVTKLGRDAFNSCHSLVEVQFNEGLRIIEKRAFEDCTALRDVTIPSTVTKLSSEAFYGCSNLLEVKLTEGLQVIGDCSFGDCTALRSVTIPSTVTELGEGSFFCCRSLIDVQLKEGLKVIGGCAFINCSALRSVTIPSTVTELGSCAFYKCSNLSEVILLNGERFLNQEFLARGVREEQGLLDQGALDEILFDENRNFAFSNCPLMTAVKISISFALSERMARLPRERRVSVLERMHNLLRIELLQDGNVLACFPDVNRVHNDEAGDDSDDEAEGVQDTNHETARSLHQVLQMIAFHELKESSIVIELAMWKSRIDGDRARANCRVPIPDPAKSLIMEYCGFAGFLTPAIEGA